MKNLKKVLALVLVFAMSLTLFAGAADFSDQADIRSSVSEAVDTLVALGIINGYSDGSFRPDDTVTRAEMAKMIYAARTGTDSSTGFEGSSTTFTDITGHWAAGYVKYCQAMGIINGRSATQFDPDAIVTTQEAAKMLLVSLGYDADTAGLTGSDWARKTISLAYDNNLFDKVATQVTGNLPRQDAAQLIFNAIEADVVTLENGVYVTKEITKTTSQQEKTGQQQITYALKDGTGANATTIEIFYNREEATEERDRRNKEENTEKYNVVTQNSDIYTWTQKTETVTETMGQRYLNLSSDENTLTLVQKESGKNTYKVVVGGQTFTKVEKDYSALLGQNVKILSKASDEVYGLFATNKNQVVLTGIVDDFDDVTGNPKRVKFDGTQYKTDANLADVPVYYTGENSNSSTVPLRLGAVLEDSTKVTYKLTLISNDDDDAIDVGYITPLTVNKVTYIGTDNITFAAVPGQAAVGNQDKDDLTTYEGIAKDDYVAVVDEKYTVDGKYSVTKLDKVTGDATGTKDKQVMINNSWYKNTDGVTTTYNINSTYDLYVIGKFIYFSEKSAGANADDIVFIDDISRSSTTKASAKVFYADGKSETIVIAKVDDVATQSNPKYISALKAVIVADYNVGKAPSDQITVDDVTAAMISAATYNQVDRALQTFLNGIYEYEVKSGELELTSFSTSDNNPAGFKSYIDETSTNGALYNNKRIGRYAISDDATVFVKSEAKDEVRVMTGKAVTAWGDKSEFQGYGNGGAAALIDAKNGIDYVMVAALVDSRRFPGSSGNEAYGYVTADPYTAKDSNDDTITYFQIWNGTTTISVYADDNYVTGGNKISKGDPIRYEVVSDSEISDPIHVQKIQDDSVVGVNPPTNLTPKTFGAMHTTTSIISFAEHGSAKFEAYNVVKDTQFIGIQSKDKKGAGGELSTITAMTTGEANKEAYYVNGWMVLDDDGDVAAIFLDVDNKLEIKDNYYTVTIRDTTPGHTITKSTTGNASNDVDVVVNTSAKEGAEVAVVVKNTTTENIAVTVSVAVTDEDGKTVTVKADEDNTATIGQNEANSFTFKMPTSNAKIVVTATKVVPQVTASVDVSAVATEIIDNKILMTVSHGDKFDQGEVSFTVTNRGIATGLVVTVTDADGILETKTVALTATETIKFDADKDFTVTLTIAP